MNQSHYPASSAASRAFAPFDSLLVLCRALTASRREVLTSETLDLVLDATGDARGAVYAVRGGALQLVAHRGLPASLREQIERLPMKGPAWFIAQKAVQVRALVSARDVSTAYGSGRGAATFAAAGWTHAVACPIAAGHELHGVMMLASPATEAPDERDAVVEIACHLLGLQMARGSEAPRSDGAGRAHVAALGVLACGYMSEVDEQLAAIERSVARAELIARRLDASGSDVAALDLAAVVASSSAALRQAKEIGGRLCSTFQSAFAPAGVPGSEPRPPVSRSGGASAPIEAQPQTIRSVVLARLKPCAPDLPTAPTEPALRAPLQALGHGHDDDNPPTPATHGSPESGRVRTWDQLGAPSGQRGGT